MNVAEIIGLLLQALVDAVIFIIAPLVISMIRDVSELKTNMQWVMSGFKVQADKAGHMLHSPHTPDFDRLIEEFWHGTLTEQQAAELCEKLERVIHEDENNPIKAGMPYTQGQKTAAISMMAAIKILHKI